MNYFLRFTFQKLKSLHILDVLYKNSKVFLCEFMEKLSAFQITNIAEIIRNSKHYSKLLQLLNIYAFIKRCLDNL